MIKTPESPGALREYASRDIKDGKVVLKVAGIDGIRRVDVEVHRNGKIEHPIIPTNTDEFSDAYNLYSSYENPRRHRKAA